MKSITIVWSSFSSSEHFQRCLQVNDDARIEDILADFCAWELALYEFDAIGSGGHVIGDYVLEGPLEDGKCYCVVSKNIHRTKAIMRRQ